MRITILTALIISVFSFGPAFADVPPQLPPSGAVLLANGTGNNCAAKYYPPSAIRDGEEGDAILKLQIDANGIVTKIDVERSSGFADLDEASIDCAAGNWHFHPATSNGTPVSSSKEYKIVWRLTDGFSPRLLTKAHDFCQEDLHKKGSWEYANKEAVLKYRVMPDGHVQDLFVVASSRDSSFDIFAAQCISRLSYAPFTGMPTGVSWGAEVFGDSDGIDFGDGHGMWHSCDDDFSASPQQESSDHDATIAYRIIGGGATTAVTVDKASGDTGFDQFAQTCVAQWQYHDRLLLGPDLNLKMRARIIQKNGHLYVFESLAD